ncbi:hypothetical protein [Pseudomonas koreensis]|uniref:hypothetical protein n=1 Tax=Pseudomonas koreensis TaxID=198620 RepID=UPI001B344D0E|nr:hypothetical protein [Pseudomonas koreensis]MBP3997848.1 hypothetical protein [Pseudomonas koreensis]
MKHATPPIGGDTDWRLQSYTYLAEDWVSPWSGVLSPRGTRITVSSVIQLTKKKQLTIPLPNATALLLNSSTLAFVEARKIRERSGIDKTLHAEVSFPSDAEAFDYLESMIKSVILAFTALEAFVNETIPVDFFYARYQRSEIVMEAASKETIERHTPLDEKLTKVLPEILQCPSPKGGRSWQGYRQLKNSRDRIIHMKTDDRRSSGAEIDTVWKAIVVAPAPHLAAKAVIDHFIGYMQEKPNWHKSFPYATS